MGGKSQKTLPASSSEKKKKKSYLGNILGKLKESWKSLKFLGFRRLGPVQAHAFPYALPVHFLTLLPVSVDCISGLYRLHQWPPTLLTFGWVWPMVFSWKELRERKESEVGVFLPLNPTLGNALGGPSLLASSLRSSDGGLLSMTPFMF